LNCNHTCFYYVVETGFGLLGAVNLDWVVPSPGGNPGNRRKHNAGDLK
jgi:hypothetical protein